MKPPRIGVDYLPAVCHAPGVGRYARELVRAMVRLPDRPELALFEVGGGARTMEGPALGLENARVFRKRSRAPRRAVRWLHRVTGVGADRLLGGVDLFHRVLPDYPPVSRAPQLLPIAELPAAGTPADSLFARAVAAVDDVLVFCRHYEDEVQRRYGKPPDRVHRVHVGCDHWVRDAPFGSGERAGPTRILVLGALRKERHPLAVLRGFEALRAGGVPAELTFAGAHGSAAEELERALATSPARDAVTWISAPIERDMPALVAGASVLCHLADDEGTAVTPLEAFAAGVPVVASCLPAFEEALGPAATLVAPDAHADGAFLADALAAAIGDSAAEAAGVRAGIAARHTWTRNAEETLAVWRTMLARRR